MCPCLPQDVGQRGPSAAAGSEWAQGPSQGRENTLPPWGERQGSPMALADVPLCSHSSDTLISSLRCQDTTEAFAGAPRDEPRPTVERGHGKQREGEVSRGRGEVYWETVTVGLSLQEVPLHI